ncbi:MAG TPA: ATP-binding protein [Acidimicrobiales bacterium]|nr:ATP-binding protein [Acidimicrobiales bacterium]
MKEFVALLHGSVAVATAPEGGARFTVTLPLALPAGAAVERGAAPAGGATDQFAKALLDELRGRAAPAAAVPAASSKASSKASASWAGRSPAGSSQPILGSRRNHAHWRRANALVRRTASARAVPRGTPSSRWARISR